MHDSGEIDFHAQYGQASTSRKFPRRLVCRRIVTSNEVDIQRPIRGVPAMTTLRGRMRDLRL
jgi:hypothetical protein